jgi:hypothetical protein
MGRKFFQNLIQPKFLDFSVRLYSIKTSDCCLSRINGITGHQATSRQPGVDVMITIFCDFS